MAVRPAPAVLNGSSRTGKGVQDTLLGFVDRNAWWLFPAPAGIVLAAIMLFPSLFNLYMSMQDWFIASAAQPKFIGLKNFSDLLFEDTNFRESVWRTFYFSALSVSVQLILGLAIALLLNREMKGHKVIRTLFMLPMMATPTAIALVWVLIYNPSLGVLNYLIGLVGLPPQEWLGNWQLVIPALAVVDTWQNTPFVTLVLLAGLASLPVEPIESARIDGANSWQVFWHITLPLLRPAILVAALFRIIDTLKTFDTIYVMTMGGPGRASQTMNLYAFQSAFEYFHAGYASAISLALIALVFAVTSILIRMRRGAE